MYVNIRARRYRGAHVGLLRFQGGQAVEDAEDFVKLVQQETDVSEFEVTVVAMRRTWVIASHLLVSRCSHVQQEELKLRDGPYLPP